MKEIISAIIPSIIEKSSKMFEGPKVEWDDSDTSRTYLRISKIKKLKFKVTNLKDDECFLFDGEVYKNNETLEIKENRDYFEIEIWKKEGIIKCEINSKEYTHKIKI